MTGYQIAIANEGLWSIRAFKRIPYISRKQLLKIYGLINGTTSKLPKIQYFFLHHVGPGTAQRKCVLLECPSLGVLVPFGDGTD